MSRRYWIAALILIATACSSGEKSDTHNNPKSRLLQAKPDPKDEYRTLMTKNLINFEQMSLGFMNFDKDQIRVAAGNLQTVGKYLAENIPPAYQEQSTDWKSLCGELESGAADIGQKSQGENYEELRVAMKNVMRVCMECHLLYRKHLLKGNTY